MGRNRLIIKITKITIHILSMMYELKATVSITC